MVLQGAGRYSGHEDTLWPARMADSSRKGTDKPTTRVQSLEVGRDRLLSSFPLTFTCVHMCVHTHTLTHTLLRRKTDRHLCLQKARK